MPDPDPKKRIPYQDPTGSRVTTLHIQILVLFFLCCQAGPGGGDPAGAPTNRGAGAREPGAGHVAGPGGAGGGPEAAGARGPGGQPGPHPGEARDRGALPQRDQTTAVGRRESLFRRRRRLRGHHVRPEASHRCSHGHAAAAATADGPTAAAAAGSTAAAVFYLIRCRGHGGVQRD